MVYVAGKRFPLKNAVFQRQIAACGAVFRNGDRAGVQIEVFLAERLPRGYMCMAVQENIAGAERRQVRGWQTFRRAYRLSPGHAPRGLVQTTGTAGGYDYPLLQQNMVELRRKARYTVSRQIQEKEPEP